MDEVDDGRRQTLVLLCLGSGRLQPDLMRCLHAVGAVGVVAATAQHAEDLSRALPVDLAALDDAFLRAEPRALRVVAAAAAPVVHVGQAPSPPAAVATSRPTRRPSRSRSRCSGSAGTWSTASSGGGRSPWTPDDGRAPGTACRCS